MILNDYDHQRIISESHERSKHFGISREQVFPNKVIANDEFQRLLVDNQEFISLAVPVTEQLQLAVRGSGLLIVLTDQAGCILFISGDEELILASERLKMIPGAYMSEQSIGTNAMGTAISINQPIQISAEEHFVMAYQRWTCSAAPVHDTNGRLTGTLNLTGNSERVHPHTLALVITAVQAIENSIKSSGAQKQLLEANQYAFTLMNNLAFGVFAIDLNDEVHWVNDTACGYLDIRRSHLIGKPVSELFAPWDSIRRKVLLGENYIDEEGHLKTAGGREKYMVNVYPIHTPEGEILGFMLTFREFKRIINLVNKYSGSHARFTFDDIIGSSRVITELVQYARKIADSPSSILITGESGTGKEVFAQAIHNASRRRDGAFVAINCGAISPTLIESELFGYEYGAFTGARKGGRAGKFELADKGTLFLDEIAEMPVEMQVKLLRTIQEGAVTRIGGDREIKIDVRIIAATNKILSEEVKKGRFRLDLFYRLNVVPLHIPALSQRKEDIRALVRFFLKQKAVELNKRIPYISPMLNEKIEQYPWPGNIRELENFIEKTVLLDGKISEISAPDPNPADEPGKIEPTNNLRANESPLNIEEAEKQAIINAITFFEGNVTRAAKFLGISRNTYYLKSKKYNLKPS